MRHDERDRASRRSFVHEYNKNDDNDENDDDVWMSVSASTRVYVRVFYESTIISFFLIRLSLFFCFFFNANFMDSMIL